MTRQTQTILSTALCLAALWWMAFTPSHAQTEPVPAYVGCTIAWDYPADQINRVTNFTLVLDDITNRAAYIRVPPTQLSVPCSEFALTPGIHTIYAWAWSESEKRTSAKAALEFVYSEILPDPIPMPTSIRIQMEWIAQ